MIYNKKDVDNILENIEKQYDLSTIYHIDPKLSVHKNANLMSHQMMTAIIVSDILYNIRKYLKDIEQPDAFSSSLDIPTECHNCFAKRDNGICWVCAFTGDMSESGFFQKYNVMENCPFLTQKRIDDLAYNFLQEIASSSYQDFINDLDNDWRDKIRKSVQESINNLFGDDRCD